MISLIEFENVSFTYDNGERNTGVYDIDLKILQGEVVVFCGESGCGKTTMTRLINGLIPGYYKGKLLGEVIVRDYKISDNPINELSRYVGSVFQNPRTQFFNVDSTSEIAFACENFGVSREEICKRIGKVTQELNIKNLLDRSLFSMSGGEKQKIACASASVMSPKIFVLDEPSSNLDIRSIVALKNILLKWKEKRSTIVIAEHRLRYLMDVADKFVYMKDGRIQKIFTQDEFQKLSDNELNFMGLRTTKNKGFKSFERNVIKPKMIEISNLSFSYDKKSFLSISDIKIPQKSIVGVLGFNGSGKSTFSKCLCGIEKKSKGIILIDEDVYLAKDRLKKCFMVMQDVNHQLFTESVSEEIALSLGNNENKEKIIHELCKKLNLEDVMNCHPMSLSGGQKQRVAIASAIASNRDILILDEPTSGLDFKNMKEVSSELIKLSQMGKTIFVVTHDPELLESCCDYFLFLESGNVKWYGSLNEKTLNEIETFFQY